MYFANLKQTKTGFGGRFEGLIGVKFAKYYILVTVCTSQKMGFRIEDKQCSK